MAATEVATPAAFQRRNDLSTLPATTSCVSGANATAVIASVGPRNDCRSRPSLGSYNFTVPSNAPAASVRPAGEKARHQNITPSGPAIEIRSVQSAVCQSLIVASSLAVATVTPSGEIAIARTAAVCPFNFASGSPSAKFHTIAVRSALPEISCSPPLRTRPISRRRYGPSMLWSLSRPPDSRA